MCNGIPVVKTQNKLQELKSKTWGMHFARHLIDGCQEAHIAKIGLFGCVTELFGKRFPVGNSLVGNERHETGIFVKCYLKVILSCPLVSPGSETKSHGLLCILAPPNEEEETI